MAAQKMARDFFEGFERVMLEVYPPAAPAPAVERPVGLWARFVTALRRLFGLR
jgi:hypothetical protein